MRVLLVSVALLLLAFTARSAVYFGWEAEFEGPVVAFNAEKAEKDIRLMPVYEKDIMSDTVDVGGTTIHVRETVDNTHAGCEPCKGGDDINTKTKGAYKCRPYFTPTEHKNFYGNMELNNDKWNTLEQCDKGMVRYKEIIAEYDKACSGTSNEYIVRTNKDVPSRAEASQPWDKSPKVKGDWLFIPKCLGDKKKAKEPKVQFTFGVFINKLNFDLSPLLDTIGSNSAKLEGKDDLFGGKNGLAVVRLLTSYWTQGKSELETKLKGTSTKSAPLLKMKIKPRYHFDLCKLVACAKDHLDLFKLDEKKKAWTSQERQLFNSPEVAEHVWNALYGDCKIPNIDDEIKQIPVEKEGTKGTSDATCSVVFEYVGEWGPWLGTCSSDKKFIDTMNAMGHKLVPKDNESKGTVVESSTTTVTKEEEVSDVKGAKTTKSTTTDAPKQKQKQNQKQIVKQTGPKQVEQSLTPTNGPKQVEQSLTPSGPKSSTSSSSLPSTDLKGCASATKCTNCYGAAKKSWSKHSCCRLTSAKDEASNYSCREPSKELTCCT